MTPEQYHDKIAGIINNANKELGFLTTIGIVAVINREVNADIDKRIEAKAEAEQKEV